MSHEEVLSMAKGNLSPAVVSLRSERRHRAGTPNELEKALEDTFPASDPVSLSSAVVQAGAPKGEAVSDAPRVDEALAATRRRDEDSILASEEAAALRDELLSLRDRAIQAGVDLKHHAGERMSAHYDGLETTIHRRPWAAVAIAAGLGYIVGRFR
jgi:ElaB/YqjD/DUF883 family membrane-anchored ribosome-binding protein